MRLATLRRGAIGALIATGCALALGSTAAVAESACQGLEQGACEKKADCSWVGGYEKKDGKHVSGYCRTKSTGGAAEDKKADVKKDAKEAGAKTPAMPAAPNTPAMPKAPKTPELPAAATGAKTPAMPATPSIPSTVKDKAKLP